MNIISVFYFAEIIFRSRPNYRRVQKWTQDAATWSQIRKAQAQNQSFTIITKQGFEVW